MKAYVFILAWLAGAVVYFCGSWVLYDNFFNAFFKLHITQYSGLINDSPRLGLAIGANLAITLLILVEIRYSKLKTTVINGALIGLFAALICGIFLEFQMTSYLNLMDWSAMMLDIGITAFLGACAGFVMSLVFRIGPIRGETLMFFT
jgi:glucan phosphoethanolaminetransferase (alkaline phosphatase superfamily)